MSRFESLEIGVNIAPEPTVQISLFNQRNAKIDFSQKAWDEFYNNRSFLLDEYFSSNYVSYPILEYKLDGEIIVKFIDIYNRKAISFVKNDQTVSILGHTCMNMISLYDAVNFSIE